MTEQPDGGATADPPPGSVARLRAGVALVLVWLVPLWWLSPLVARLLGLLAGEPPSVVAVTTVIVVVQTVLGLVGLALAGTQVKKLVKGMKVRRAVPVLWRVLVRGSLPEDG